MKAEEIRRLADLRSSWVRWSAATDTSTWEATFFFQLLDEKNRELRELRKKLHHP